MKSYWVQDTYTLGRSWRFIFSRCWCIIPSSWALKKHQSSLCLMFYQMMKSLTSVGVFIINCWVSKISEYPLSIILSFKSTARRKNYPKKGKNHLPNAMTSLSRENGPSHVSSRFAVVIESQDIDSAVGSCPKETVLEHYLQQSRLAQMLPRHDISPHLQKNKQLPDSKKSDGRCALEFFKCTSNGPQKIKRIHGIRNIYVL